MAHNLLKLCRDNCRLFFRTHCIWPYV